MATYQDIRGLRVKYLSADPSNTATGEVWYNSTTGTLRTNLLSEAWASGAPTIAPVYAGGAAGTSTAGLAFAGTPATTATYEYNGGGWSTVPAVTGTPRSYVSSSGAGSQTAALVVGGESPPPSPTGKTESYDGSSWTAKTDMTTARDSGLGFGTQTAFINSGGVLGYPWGVPASTASEEFNGASWTATPAVNNPRAQGGGLGVTTAGLIFGGRTASPATSPAALVATTESYNGSSWTAENVMNTGRLYANSGSGTLTAAVTGGGIAYPGGSPVVTGATEKYDGTSWTTSPASLATVRYVGAGGFGSGTSAVVFGGRSGGSIYDLTEEFNSSGSVITAGAWASGGAMGTARIQTAGAGSQTAGLAFGGETPGGDTANTEEYNGTSWSEQTNLPATTKDQTGFGTQTAGVSCSGAPTTVTYKYDGTNWTSSGTLNTGRTNAAGCGTSTAGVIFAGSPSITATEEFNGSIWSTNPNAIPQGGSNRFGTGTQIAALAAFGGPPFIATTQEYDGSSWTTGGGGITPRADSRGGGTQTDAIAGGGYNPGHLTSVEGYDGTSWSTRPSLSQSHTGGSSGQGAAPASLNWIAGGNPATTATEEFTGETSAVNIETLTTS